MELVLQVGRKPSWADTYSCIHHRGFVSYDELPDRFSEADMLFLPYDFTPSATAFIKYSMPTKASEYMISGTPILIFAPKDTALVTYAKDYQWAKVVTKNEVAELKAAILEFVDSRETRERIASTAIKIAEQRHDSLKVKEAFRNELSALASHHAISLKPS